MLFSWADQHQYLGDIKWSLLGGKGGRMGADAPSHDTTSI